MNYRNANDWHVSEIGVGCYALSGVYGDKDPDEFRRMLYRAIDLGVNLFDTADTYGDAERFLGESLKPFRSRVYLATKVGARPSAQADLSPAYIQQACENSLRALQTDCIDLYHVHFDDPATPVAETVEALEALVEQGKIRHYGLGHLPQARVECYLEIGRVFSIMMELSAVTRGPRKWLLPRCRESGVHAIAFSATGRGLLTGKIGPADAWPAGDIRAIDPLFQRERLASALRIADHFAAIGSQYGKSPVQTALAWVLAQPGVLCALTGPSSIAHLQENLGGSGWQFAAADLEALEAFLSAEEQRLEAAQRASIVDILNKPLSADPQAAFKDLLYAIETALELGICVEAALMPIFVEFFTLRKRLDQATHAELEHYRFRLREIIAPEG